MYRYRLIPAPAQEAVLRGHCAHARYVWNLAVEQHAHWHQGRAGAPGYLEQCRQLTAARAEYDWLRQGSQMVQQQGGVVVAAALSTGELLYVPGLTARERKRLRRLERRHARGRRGSHRRGRVRLALSRLRARQTDRRKDWAEKASTGIARRFDLIKVEDLQIKNMTRSAKGTRGHPGRNIHQKAGLNRGILASGWGLLVRRLEDKAPGRVERINPAFTSQRCSACGQVDAKSRESQARFACTACGFVGHADLNAAKNIAAGHAVTARGGVRGTGPANREPHLLASLTGRE